MKRWFCLLQVAMMLTVALGGCGGSGGSSRSNGTSNTGTGNTGTGNTGTGDTGSGDSGGGTETSGAIPIVLNGTTATYNGVTIEAYDYVWHVSPSRADEYYTEGLNGSEVDNDTAEGDIGGDAVTIARDIRYIPSGLSFSGTAKNDDETEAASYYDSSVTLSGFTGPFIFATLPQANKQSTMTHSASEAYACPVLHINEPGTYSLSGTWNGQIWIDAGDEDDENARVTLILNGVTVNCAVGPALVFHDLYECGPASESAVTALGAASVGAYVTANAGAKVVIADGTTNNFTGSNVYRMLKVQAKKDSVTVIDGTDVEQQKKRYKMDGAFYSFVSMAISGGTKGDGVLNVTSTTYEGLDAEMHLTISGGVVNVNSADDGINVNEDDVSVFTLNGGTLTIVASGGDGIDSNGWIYLNSGKLDITSAGTATGPEGPLDADKGIVNNLGNNYTYQTTDGMGDDTGGTPPNGGNGGPSGETPPDGMGGTPPSGGSGVGGTPPSA